MDIHSLISDFMIRAMQFLTFTCFDALNRIKRHDREKENLDKTL